jgi:endonuclease III
MTRKPKPNKSKPAETAAAHPFDLPPVTPAERARALALLEALEAEYPSAHCELNYTKPHELLIATILSAQSTDVGVNKATPALFAKFPTPAHYAAASPAQIEPYIRTTGFFRMKARAVHESMKTVVERFGGQVPRTMDELLSLCGVARKTANVVLGNAFSTNVGFVVDTHVDRLSKRFGLVERTATVQAIERRLMALFPQERWCELSHMIIWHGRRACKARGTACSRHPICTRFGVACDLRDIPVTPAQRKGIPKNMTTPPRATPDRKRTKKAAPAAASRKHPRQESNL